MSHKPYADRSELAISHARSYTAPGVTVFYDRGRWLHFAECMRGLPQVFDIAKRPWIQPDNASAEEVAEVVLWYLLAGEASTGHSTGPGGAMDRTWTDGLPSPTKRSSTSMSVKY